jgi:hypothetical protein
LKKILKKPDSCTHTDLEKLFGTSTEKGMTSADAEQRLRDEGGKMAIVLYKCADAEQRLRDEGGKMSTYMYTVLGTRDEGGKMATVLCAPVVCTYCMHILYAHIVCTYCMHLF